MTNIIDKGYRVTPEQIEHMARDAAKGYATSETYLRCLIVAAQENKRRGVNAVNAAHEVFYAAVLRGVENNQRAAIFARTAAATLRGYIRKGGKLADIDVSTATKGFLRKFGAPAEPTDRAERSASRANAMLLRAIKRMAKRDAVRARELVRETVEALREAVPNGRKAAPHDGHEARPH